MSHVTADNLVTDRHQSTQHSVKWIENEACNGLILSIRGFYSGETQMPTTKSEIQAKNKFLNNLESISYHAKFFFKSSRKDLYNMYFIKKVALIS